MFGRIPKITLCHLGRVPVRVDATFLFVPLLLTSLVSFHRLAEAWHIVVIGTVGTFLSILLHELGHAFTAKKLQVGVSEIVVGGFFGFARLKRQAIPRKDRIAIFAAGPLANLAVFLALWGLLSVFLPAGGGLLGLEPTHGSSLDWLWQALVVLAILNLAMFIFNVLPAVPLDGGRILDLLLVRTVSEHTRRRLVAGSGIAVGAATAIFGLTVSVVLMIIGIMIVVTNLRLLRRKATAA